MTDEPHIPSRNTEWATPFSPVAPVNADADATRHVVTYSAGRRITAMLVTVGASILVVMMIAAVSTSVPEVVDANGDIDGRRAAYILLYREVLVWTAICGLAVWGTWHWAHRPVDLT